MQLVRFTGRMAIPAKSRRVLDQETLTRLGVDVPESLLTNGELVFGPGTNHTVEMSNEASDSLVAALPDEFHIVEDSDEVEAVMQPLTDQSESLKNSDADDDDENDDDEESSDDD